MAQRDTAIRNLCVRGYATRPEVDFLIANSGNVIVSVLIHRWAHSLGSPLFFWA